MVKKVTNYLLLRDFMDDKVTLGELFKPDGELLAVTLELPWYDNITGMSCIPAGIYPCIPHDSPAHPDTWEVTKVPGRSEILIHTGNTVKDSKGCILVGDRRGLVGDAKAVLNSRATMDKLREILPPHFTLEVRQ